MIIGLLGFVCSFGTLCITHGLRNAKFFILRFARERNLQNYVEMGFHMVHAICKMYFVKFLLFNRNDISAFLAVLRERRQDINDDQRRQEHKVLLAIYYYYVALL